MWTFKPVPPIDEPNAVAMFSLFSDEELEDASLARPDGADEDSDPADTGILIAQLGPTGRVLMDAVMLEHIEELMTAAVASEADIERVFEEVGDDDMRLVIWIGGPRFWVGALRAMRVKGGVEGIGQA